VNPPGDGNRVLAVVNGHPCLPWVVDINPDETGLQNSSVWSGFVRHASVGEGVEVPDGGRLTALLDERNRDHHRQAALSRRLGSQSRSHRVRECPREGQAEP
jgi:hypothetical protein